MITLETKTTAAKGVALYARSNGGKLVKVSTCFCNTQAALQYGKERRRFINRLVKRSYQMGRPLTFIERIRLV